MGTALVMIGGITAYISVIVRLAQLLQQLILRKLFIIKNTDLNYTLIM